MQTNFEVCRTRGFQEIIDVVDERYSQLFVFFRTSIETDVSDDIVVLSLVVIVETDLLVRGYVGHRWFNLSVSLL